MSTVIELPDALTERLRAAAAAEGLDLNNYAVSRLEIALDAGYEEDSDVLSVLGGVIDDYAAGDRGTPVAEFTAELDRKYGSVSASNSTP